MIKLNIIWLLVFLNCCESNTGHTITHIQNKQVKPETNLNVQFKLEFPKFEDELQSRLTFFKLYYSFDNLKYFHINGVTKIKDEAILLIFDIDSGIIKKEVMKSSYKIYYYIKYTLDGNKETYGSKQDPFILEGKAN